MCPSSFDHAAVMGKLWIGKEMMMNGSIWLRFHYRVYTSKKRVSRIFRAQQYGKAKRTGAGSLLARFSCLATGQAQLLAHDPYARLSARAETGIPPSQRAIRDARWACIDALIQMPETTLYSPEARAQALRALEQAWLAQHGVDPASEEASAMQKSFRKQVLKCLRLYWQRG